VIRATTMCASATRTAPTSFDDFVGKPLKVGDSAVPALRATTHRAREYGFADELIPSSSGKILNGALWHAKVQA
jgi:hypothetical protein